MVKYQVTKSVYCSKNRDRPPMQSKFSKISLNLLKSLQLYFYVWRTHWGRIFCNAPYKRFIEEVHSAISECHSHSLRFCVAFTHIQHQGSLSSVTSPSANQQPAIHKSGTSGEVDRDWPVVFRCTPAHPLPTHGNLCTQCSSYKPEGIHECSTFMFIDN